jgi:flagellar biosynthesis protein FlhB
MQEPEQNRTEQATQHKRSDARKRGQVAKSLDFNTMLIMTGFAAVLSTGAASGVMRLEESCRALLIAAAHADEAATLWAALQAFSGSLMAMMLPICVAALLLAITANVIQAGPILSADPIKPDFNRLNPIGGFKRVYTKRLLVEGLKALIKLACFGAITTAFFTLVWPMLPDLQNGDAIFQLGWFAAQARTLVFRILLVLLIIGLLDILWSRWQYSRQLMMSRREVKQEIKRREGDPLVRRRLRELQRENLKQARSLGRIRKADVLITNPTHVAVALAYDRATMTAPQVVARGAGLWAAQMKVNARRHRVTILERRPLAQMLYKLGAIDRPIPVETYMDVAQVYAELPRTRATLLSGALSAAQPAGALP